MPVHFEGSSVYKHILHFDGGRGGQSKKGSSSVAWRERLWQLHIFPFIPEPSPECTVGTKGGASWFSSSLLLRKTSLSALQDGDHGPIPYLWWVWGSALRTDSVLESHAPQSRWREGTEQMRRECYSWSLKVTNAWLSASWDLGLSWFVNLGTRHLCRKCVGAFELYFWFFVYTWASNSGILWQFSFFICKTGVVLSSSSVV